MTIFSRRAFFASSAAASVVLATTVAARADAQAENCKAYDPDKQKKISPDGAVQALKEGNKRFIDGKMERCDLLAQVRATADQQSPFAMVLGCIDSRVAPELIFDQQIGSIFSVRIAGNFVNSDIIGSLEFGTKVIGSKAIVVLGHSGCGAIKGAIDDVQLGNITGLLANIKPAVEAAVGDAKRTSKDVALVNKVTDTNVELAVKNLTEKSPILKELVDNKQLVIVGAVHDIATGIVRFL